MRDVNRIDYILEKLGNIWKKFPDLRLGQLLLNVARDPELYYIEDKELIDKLRMVYAPTEEDLQLSGFFTLEGDKKIFNYRGFKIEVAEDLKNEKLYFTFNNREYEEPLDPFGLYSQYTLKDIVDKYLENKNN